MNTPYFKVAAHGLIQKGNKFLVTHRPANDDYKPNLWDIPGGTVEFTENVYQCLEREISEEAGLVVKIKEPIFVYDFLSDEFRHQFQIVYKCEYVTGDIKLDPIEHDEFNWVTIEEMAELPKIAFLEALYLQLTQR